MDEQNRKLIDEDLLQESVKTTFKQFGLFNSVASVIPGLCLAFLIYYISNDFFRPFTWFTLNTLVVVVGYVLFKIYEKDNQITRASILIYQKWLIWIAFAHSLTWAFLVLISDLSHAREAPLILVCTGMVILVASNAVGLNQKIYLAFLCPFILLSLLKYFSSPIILEFLCVVSACLIIGYGQAINARAVLKKSIRLRNENRYLLQVAEEKRNEALQANESKSKFLAAASHDLRQPLQSIEFLAYTISHTDSAETQKRIFPKLNSSVKALRELLDSLLDLSKIEARAITPDSDYVSLDNIIKETSDQFEGLALSKGIKLHLSLNSVYVYSDRKLLGRIFSNIIDNAINHSQANDITISIDKLDDDGLIQVCIKDSGKGIPEEFRDKIFEEFFQLENPECDRSKGLGLGLAIVKELSALLDVSLDMESSDLGTEFILKLPYIEYKPKFEESVKSIDNATDKKVVVIDDDIEVRESITVLLQTLEYQVEAFDSGKDFLSSKTFDSSNFDAVIVDNRLGKGEEGIVVADRISQKHRHKDIIILTGDTDPIVLSGLHSSSYQILNKPVEAENLIESLHSGDAL